MGGLLHLVQRGWTWADCGPAQSPPRCTKYSSPPINGQCTDFILSDNNNNNNNHDNVYGAVIMAEPLREFTRFI